MSDDNFSILLRIYGNGTPYMGSIMRCSGLYHYPCVVCSWTLMHECPACYQEQQFFRNTPDLSTVCPIILTDTMIGCHIHCLHESDVTRPWTPSRPTINGAHPLAMQSTSEEGGHSHNQLV